jgi:hypothetical protein
LVTASCSPLRISFVLSSVAINCPSYINSRLSQFLLTLEALFSREVAIFNNCVHLGDVRQ